MSFVLCLPAGQEMTAGFFHVHYIGMPQFIEGIYEPETSSAFPAPGFILVISKGGIL